MANSWEHIKKVKQLEEKRRYTFYQNNKKKEGWEYFWTGKEFADKDGWWKKTENGREKIKEPTNKYIIPMFCPKCKKIMKRGKLDENAFFKEGHCFICHVNKKNGIKLEKENE